MFLEKCCGCSQMWLPLGVVLNVEAFLADRKQQLFGVVGFAILLCREMQTCTRVNYGNNLGNSFPDPEVSEHCKLHDL